MYWKNLQSEQDKYVELANVPNSNWGDINYNPQRQILAAGFGSNQGAIYQWDLKNGELKQSLRGHNGWITGIDFSNDGSMMASSSYDGSVRLWHLDDLGTLPVVFDDHGTWVTSVMFTKDDGQIISGDKDGNIRKYYTDIKMLLNGFCSYLSRDLTQSEWQNYVGTDIPYKPTKCVNK